MQQPDTGRRRGAASHDGRHRVVIVGGGFAGLTAARRLGAAARKWPLDVTLVDRHNYHTFQPLLYQVATAGLEAQGVGQSLRAILRRRPASFRLGAVVDADLDRKRVVVDGGELEYDTLVLAAGASTADYGIDGVAEHALPLKSLPEATRLRNHLLHRLEHVAVSPSRTDPAARTFVIAGGGPTGVELAGALSDLTRRVVRSELAHADLSPLRIVLVEMLDGVLPAYHERSRTYARKALESLGVEVRVSTAIERVGPESVVLSDGDEIPTSTVVWTAGIRANPLADVLDLDQTKGGRIEVGPDLRVPGRPDVFVIGDLAGAVDPRGEPLPQLAPVAIQQGRHVADQIVRLRARQGTRPFRYRDKGVMAVVGRRDAVAELPFGVRLYGIPARLAWLAIHLLWLVGFRNRASVLIDWLYNYATFDRAARILLDQHEPDEAAHLEKAQGTRGSGG